MRITFKLDRQEKNRRIRFSTSNSGVDGQAGGSRFSVPFFRHLTV
jgi:hypothetical protein